MGRTPLLGPVCRNHHRKPDPLPPPEPTRVPFAATDTATGTHSGSEHSHGDRPAAAATATRLAARGCAILTMERSRRPEQLNARGYHSRWPGMSVDRKSVV